MLCDTPTGVTGDNRIEGIPYPNTCEKCDCRGFFEHRWITSDAEWLDELQETNPIAYECFKNDNYNKAPHWHIAEQVLPKRCNECHAKSESYRKANNTLKKLEKIRELLEVNDLTRIHNDGWKYLKFGDRDWET